MLLKFLTAFLTGFGFILGALGALILFIKLMRKRKPRNFKPEPLLNAFKAFLDELQQKERYELVIRTQRIIEQIESAIRSGQQNFTPADQGFYTVEIKTDIALDDQKEGIHKLGLDTSYIIHYKEEKKG